MALFRGPFYFLRHGQTETNRLGLIAGMRDVELNATGRREALAAAEALRERGIGAIYSSPLGRARHTAQCVADALGLPVTLIAELAERNWGELEGRPRELRRLEATPPGGEGPQEFARRTLAGLQKIPGEPLPLIVAHSGTYRVLCRSLGIPTLEPVPVLNCAPLRFTPPSEGGAGWTVAPLGEGRLDCDSE
jgi:broad specificity phosphatase PhoE